MTLHRVPLPDLGAAYCVRCGRSGLRLIASSGICISCFNRAAEAKRGYNARGNPLRDYIEPRPRLVGVLDNAGRATWQTFDGQTLTESLARAVRGGHKIHANRPGRTRGVRQATIGCSSKRCYGSLVQVAHGGICHANLALGIASISALRAGHDAESGIVFSRNWHRMLISKRCLSTARLSAHISTRRARPKKGDQALGRSRGGLSTKIHALVEGVTRSISPHRRRGWRQPGGAAAARQASAGFAQR